MRKTAHQKRVEKMMALFGQDVPERPTVPGSQTRLLRAKLIIEEALETVEALGVGVSIRGCSCSEVTNDGLEFRLRGLPSLISIADGCADVSVVAIGTLSACGICDESLLREVDRTNIAKFATGATKREDGKWLKPKDWQPPRVAEILSSQMED